MSNDYTNTDAVHAYLRNKMEKDQLEEFEKELHNNPQLAEEVEWHKDFQKILLQSEKNSVKAHIQELIGSKKIEQPPSSKESSTIRTLWNSNRRYLAIAAMLLIAIAISFLFLPTNNNEQTLFAKHLEAPYHSPPKDVRGEKSTDWIKAYQAKQYRQVSSLLTQKEKSGELSAEEKLYLGLAYLYQKDDQTDKAIQYLETAKKENAILYEGTSNWYIALAYWKAGEKENAKKYLQEIVTQKAWKHQEAEELLLLK